MKKYLRLVICTALILGIAMVVYAGSAGPYRYLINGYEYRIVGYTNDKDAPDSYVYSQTYRVLPEESEGHDINYQSLWLRSRIWTKTCPAVLIASVSSSAGDCYNCKQTLERHMVPPEGSPGIEYIAVSKHKLQDTRATNYYTGEPPKKFFSEYGNLSVSTVQRFKGYIDGCTATPIIPSGLSDPYEED